MAANPMSNDELGVLFDRLRQEGAHHEAAEVAYAAAVRSSGSERQGWREKAIRELELAGTDDLVSASSRHQVIAGVPIPDLLHEGVIAARLDAE